VGIAVLGSLLATSYASSMDGAPEAARDSVGAAHAVAAQTGATDLVATANQAFVDAMSTTAGIAAAIAMLGAVIALAFLPARARTDDPGLVPEPAMA
jgi:MFS transporter, DHA2 family, multidrug resistance protein